MLTPLIDHIERPKPAAALHDDVPRSTVSLELIWIAEVEKQWRVTNGKIRCDNQKCGKRVKPFAFFLSRYAGGSEEVVVLTHVEGVGATCRSTVECHRTRQQTHRLRPQRVLRARRVSVEDVRLKRIRF